MLSISPYYQKGKVKLYHANIFEHLGDISPNSFNLCLTDPMYNIGFNYGEGTGLSDQLPEDDYKASMTVWHYAISQKANRVVFTPGLKNLGFWYGLNPNFYSLAWFKGNSYSRSPLGSNQWEPVIVYGEIENRNLPDAFFAPIDFDDLAEVGSFHPCPKPLSWARQLIERFHVKDRAIIDPFAGSGTVGVVCLEWGIECVLFELVEKFCAGIADRLENTEIKNGFSKLL